MIEYLPEIRETEYAAFRAIPGMAEPPAKPEMGLPPTFDEWEAWQRRVLGDHKVRLNEAIVVLIPLIVFEEFMRHVGGDASLRQLIACAAASTRPYQPPSEDEYDPHGGLNDAC